jgi:hypothetical protein
MANPQHKPAPAALVKQGQAESSASLSNTDIKNMTANSDPIDFDNLGGESFVGLNLLDLDVGEADGPFVLAKIDPTVFGSGKAAKTIDVYCANKGSTEIRMPISASFMVKVQEANLKIGDTFYVKRGKNFSSKAFGTDNCKSYLLKVTKRA